MLFKSVQTTIRERGVGGVRESDGAGVRERERERWGDRERERETQLLCY
jgi:hypothetical protein